METVYCVQEDQHVNNAIQPILISILNMIIQIASVVVQLTLILTLILQMQQITNVFYVIWILEIVLLALIPQIVRNVLIIVF